MNVSLKYLVILFLITFSVYSINRLSDPQEDQINRPEALSFTQRNKKIFLFFIIVSYCVAFLLAFLDDIWTALFVIFPLGVVLLYGIGVSSENTQRMRVKQIFLVKNLIVSFTWATMVIMLPILYSKDDLTTVAGILYSYIFIQIFIDCVATDIKDIVGDKKAQIKTIPSLYGEKKTLILLQVITLASVVFFGIVSYFYFSNMIFLTYTILSGVITILYLKYYQTTLKNTIVDVVVDGRNIICGLVLVGLLYLGFL
ncbi:MAG: UbiA family prenyltransferase [Euryarchaeota archaeon]|nr:UbiA family prenyltransferase [Euryarchaeota archaeon]